MTSLDSSLLTDHLNPITRTEIVRCFWAFDSGFPSLIQNEIDLEPYWKWYAEQCFHALHDHGRHTSARTHKDITEIVSYLKGNYLRTDIKEIIRSKLSSPALSNAEKVIDSSIDLAARLLLMVDFGNLHYGFSGHKQLDWNKGNFSEFVQSHFSASPVLGHERVKLERIFNARNLKRIAGVEIAWTTNLADHLRLTDDDTKVTIFQYASFLELQRHGSIFPQGFADETIRTLALLFPQSDPETKKWISSAPHLDQRLIRCGHLKTDDRQIENFVFWHDRLVILKQVFDEAHPNNLSQWWHDRRNGVQWYTFWVAILVLVLTTFFGIIQCIEGALQVYVSYKSIP